MEYQGVQFVAERTEVGVEVSGGFDNLAAETNTHPEDLFDLIMETIFKKEAICQR
jgi:hypothetical protein